MVKIKSSSRSNRVGSLGNDRKMKNPGKEQTNPYLFTGIDSNRLDNPHIKVLVCMGTLGSLPISSRLEITFAALFDTGSFSFESTFLILSDERLMFLGTESSLIMRSSTSIHCLMTSLGLSDTIITTGYQYKTRSAY